MSLCIGCLVAAGSFAGIGGLGGVTQWVTERRRRRAMQRVLDAPPDDDATIDHTTSDGDTTSDDNTTSDDVIGKHFDDRDTSTRDASQTVAGNALDAEAFVVAVDAPQR